MLVYNVDDGSGESVQLTGESADVLTNFLKKKGYTDVSLMTENLPFFSQGNLTMFRGKAICENSVMGGKKEIRFTVYSA